MLDRKRITRAETALRDRLRNQLIVTESKVQNIQTLNVIYIGAAIDSETFSLGPCPLANAPARQSLITSRDPDSPVGRSTFTNNPRASINREKLSQRIDRARQPLR